MRTFAAELNAEKNNNQQWKIHQKTYLKILQKRKNK